MTAVEYVACCIMSYVSTLPLSQLCLILCADDTWQTEPNAPQRDAYQQAEVHIAVAKDSSEEMTPAAIADAILDQVLQRVAELVKKDEDLCGKKGVYMKFGCRGDWPDLQPPDENADLQNAGGTAAVKAQQ